MFLSEDGVPENAILGSVFFLAIPVSLIMSLIVRSRYKASILRIMQTTTDVPERAFSVPPAAWPNGSELDFLTRSGFQQKPRWSLAARYLVAGLTFASVQAMVMFFVEATDPDIRRVVLVEWVFATPAVVFSAKAAGLRWYVILLAAVAWFGFYRWLIRT